MHGKNPNLRQKKFLEQKHLIPENWLVVKNSIEEFEIKNRKSNKIKYFRKEVKIDD